MERRQITRWRLIHKAKIKQEGAQVWVDCHIIDINLKGMQVVLPIKLQKDVCVKMQVVLSEDCTIEVQAWAAWYKTVNNMNLHGLYFTEIKEADKEKLYQFVRSYTPSEVDKKLLRKLKPQEPGRPIEDRRVFSRSAVSFPVRFLELMGFTQGGGLSRDVSAKGVGLVTKEPVSLGADLELWIELPDKGDPLYTRGRVAWLMPVGADEYRIGVNLEKADLVGLSRVLRAKGSSSNIS